jgi:hypothetical protein
LKPKEICKCKRGSANSVDNAKDFLKSYQNYTKNAFYADLESMLDNIDTVKNTTVTSENVKLAVTTQESSTTFKWTYTFNGIEAPDKCVALRYETGFLSYFIDNWDIYKIGSTEVNVSQQKAIEIAMDKAKSFTWGTTLDNKTCEDLKYNVTNAMVWETVFANSLYMNNPRGQDLLTLYPVRHIWVSFDKFYPCNVYGMNVYVWADTGEIGQIQERFTTMDPPKDLMATADDIAALTKNSQLTNDDLIHSNALSTAFIVLLMFTVFMLVTITIYWCFKNDLLELFKPLTLKVGGLLLCFLIASTMLFVATTATATALPPNGRATIWGSESSDAWNSQLQLSWRKHPNEVTRQQLTSAFIQSEFYQNGYSASNYQGTTGLSSLKSNILSQVQNDQANYARSVAVDFDHGNGLTGIPGLPSNEFHFMFEDQRGTMYGPTYHGTPADHPEYAVYDYEIYDRTSVGKYLFVLINACNSAYIGDTFGSDDSSQGMVNGRARGMPYAWSHGTKVLSYGRTDPPSGWMSGDGYAFPDNGKFCYMGFYMGSASLNQTIQGTTPYWLWLEHFFAYALTNNWSVKQALDEASQQFFDCDFDETTFGGSQGFIASWPMYKDGTWQEVFPPEQRRGWLKVYGDSNVKLHQPSITFAARDENNNPVSCYFKINGENVGTSARVINGISSVEVTGYALEYFAYNGNNYYGNPAQIPLTSDGTITAHVKPYCVVTIQSNNNNYGSVDFAGTNYWSNNYYPMHAYPNAGYVFDHWESSNYNNIWFENAYSPTSLATVVGSGTITGVFAPAVTHTATFAFWNPWNVDGSLQISVDGGANYYASLGGTPYTLTEGWHTVSYPSQCAWWTYSATYQDGNQITSSFYVGADTTIVGVYVW